MKMQNALLPPQEEVDPLPGLRQPIVLAGEGYLAEMIRLLQPEADLLSRGCDAIQDDVDRSLSRSN